MVGRMGEKTMAATCSKHGNNPEKTELSGSCGKVKMKPEFLYITYKISHYTKFLKQSTVRTLTVGFLSSMVENCTCLLWEIWPDQEETPPRYRHWGFQPDHPKTKLIFNRSYPCFEAFKQILVLQITKDHQKWGKPHIKDRKQNNFFFKKSNLKKADTL